MPRPIKKAKNKSSVQTAFTRFMLIIAFFVIWIGGIGARLVHLQINQHDAMLGKALGQRRDTVKDKQLRGTIFDRDRHALAMSVNAKSLYADPSEITDVDAAARDLSKILKGKPAEISKIIQDAKNNNRHFVWLARKLDENFADKINKTLENKDTKKSDLPRYVGLHWQEEQKRSYPNQTLAAQVLGFSNNEDVGSAGIEQSQEEILHGAVVKRWRDRDRLGRVYDEEEIEEREPPKDVVLTLSSSMQYKVEQELERGVKNANAKSGMAIVINPKNGEILAMANYPTFDPNRFTEFQPESFVNHAVHDIYSPGSVFKLVAYSGAINEKLINPNGEVDCRGGKIEVAGHIFNDPHATKVMSYADALAVSSNVAAIKTGTALGREKFYNYAQKFGFGLNSGIELPSVTNGIFRAPSTWNGDSLASMSIGYEIGVSALQVASAYATIANDGIKIQPHLIKEIRQADGQIISATEPQKTAVVSAETARGFRQMLRQVVLTGTGRRAQIDGYTVAGKTGTAWKYNAQLKKIDENKYVSSFVGMAPADNPSLVIAVVLDEPQVAMRDGGQVSAPIFHNIAEQLLPELGVAPDANVRQANVAEEKTTTETLGVPTDIKAVGGNDADKTSKTGDAVKSLNDQADKKTTVSANDLKVKTKSSENLPKDKNGGNRASADVIEPKKTEVKNKSSGKK